MVEFKVGDRVQVKADVEWNNDGTWTGAKVTGVPLAPSAFYDVTSNCGKQGMLHLEEMEPYKPNPTPIPADIAERAMALVTAMAKAADKPMRGMGIPRNAYTEARAILDALKPVSVDDKAAMELAEEWDGTDQWFDAMRAAIAKGRSLERGGE